MINADDGNYDDDDDVFWGRMKFFRDFSHLPKTQHNMHVHVLHTRDSRVLWCVWLHARRKRNTPNINTNQMPARDRFTTELFFVDGGSRRFWCRRDALVGVLWEELLCEVCIVEMGLKSVCWIAKRTQIKYTRLIHLCARWMWWYTIEILYNRKMCAFKRF